ncbi:MAG: class I SAM-dependent methyltransferase [Acidobacteriota bacterium]|nr:class I SAM-dependent methyltransferase [Acidobacteriota bacterium]
MRSFIRALRVLHREYRKFPMRTRAHVLIRFLTCPFLRVLRHLPPNARLLDIGAGHALFSVFARQNGERPTAIDPDARKVRKFAGIQSVIGYDDCIRGTFDAIAIIDVLYKMPINDWDPFLDRVKLRLKPGGTLLIKEHDPTARVKHSWNRLQERLATALHLTLGESFSYETPADFSARLRRHGFESIVAERIDAGYVHPHMLYVWVAR